VTSLSGKTSPRIYCLTCTRFQAFPEQGKPSINSLTTSLKFSIGNCQNQVLREVIGFGRKGDPRREGNWEASGALQNLSESYETIGRIGDLHFGHLTAEESQT